MSSHVIVFHDDSNLVDELTENLNQAGAEVTVAKDQNDLLYKAGKAGCDLLLAQRRDSFEEDLELLEKFRESQPKTPAYLLGERFKLTETIRAVRMGVRGVIEPPLKAREIVAKVAPTVGLEPSEATSVGSRKAVVAGNSGSTLKSPSLASRPAGKVLRIGQTKSSAGGGGSGTSSPGSAQLHDLEEENARLSKDLKAHGSLSEKEEALAREAARINAEKENLETERILLDQAKKKLEDEQKRLKKSAGSASESSDTGSDKMLAEAQAEIEDLYVQVAELKGLLKKAQAEGGGKASEGDRQSFAKQKKELEEQEEAIRDAKTFIREREAYLEECENTIMEKSHLLDEKEAELDQLREEVKQERNRLASQAKSASSSPAEETAGGAEWEAEKKELLEKIQTLEKSLESNQSEAENRSAADQEQYEESLQSLEERITEEAKARASLEEELETLRQAHESLQASHQKLTEQRDRLYRNMEDLTKADKA